MATNPMLLCYLAELDRARDLEAYERRKRYGLFETLPPARPLRSTLAAWLLRLALRLDARTGESSSSPPEPAHA
jgi:hypothetical protein